MSDPNTKPPADDDEALEFSDAEYFNDLEFEQYEHDYETN